MELPNLGSLATAPVLESSGFGIQQKWPLAPSAPSTKLNACQDLDAKLSSKVPRGTRVDHGKVTGLFAGLDNYHVHIKMFT